MEVMLCLKYDLWEDMSSGWHILKENVFYQKMSCRRAFLIGGHV